MKLQSLQILVENLVEAGFLIETRPPSLRKSGRETIIEIGDTSLVDGDFEFEENSVLHYLESIKQDRISWLLFDGSIIQIRYSIKKSAIAGYRYCYIPSPYNVDLRSNQTDNILELIDSVSVEDPLSKGRRTMLRFEFDQIAQTEHHPASHLHINSSECRIPLRAPIVVNEFVSFIMKYFYSGLFNPEICGINNFEIGETLSENEGNGFHISWRRRMA